MAVVMTRAEYETKYGVKPTPVSSAVDTSPSPPRMTRAEYELKYGTPPPTQTPSPATSPTPQNQTTNPFTVSNPLPDIQAAGNDVYSAIKGTGQYAGKNPLERGFSAASSAALAVPTVAADLIPGGKNALNIVSDLFSKGTNIAGGISSTLADAAQKVGLMSPEQRAKYDKNNAAFADSPVGQAIQSAASIGNSAGNIANVILGAHGTAEAVQNFIDQSIPAYQQRVKDANQQIDQKNQQIQSAEQQQAQQAHEQRQQTLIQQTADEIGAVENKYAKGRKANLYSKDEGQASRERIAQSGVLKYAVDENGMLRTKDQGGAADQYRAMTVKPAEGVVRQALEREGGKTNLSEVRSQLLKSVQESGLQGADLLTALNGVEREVQGLRLKADSNGYVPNTLLHDAKINTTSNINYFTPPETATYRKAIASGYKTLVEDHSNLNIREINAELAKYYEDISRLERLDGARVQGGKLGKYASQITGNIAGGAIGSLFGGPLGAAVGTVVGGEVAGMVKGKTMAGTFQNGIDPNIPKNEVLTKAVKDANAPRLALPAGNGIRSQRPSGPAIQLPSKSPSSIDASPIPSSRPIPTVPKATGKGNTTVGAAKSTTASKQSTAGNTSTSNGATGKEGVSARKADTSAPFDGGVKVYHGTNYDTLDPKKAVSINGQYGKGIYFATDANIAKQYGSKVIETRLDSNSLLKMDAPLTAEQKANLQKVMGRDEWDWSKNPTGDFVWKRLELTHKNPEALLKKAGIKGVEHNQYTSSGINKNYVIWDDTAIQSSPSIPKALEPLAKEARKYKSAEEFATAVRRDPNRNGYVPEYGTTNPYYGMTNTEELQAVADGKKPAYLGQHSKDFAKETAFAKQHGLLAEKTPDGNLVIAKTQDAIDAVRDAQTQRDLGIALGYKSVHEPLDWNGLLDLWKKANNK